QSDYHPFVGVSVYHLTRPHDYFYKNSDERVPMRFDVHGGVRVELNDKWNVIPQALFLQQGVSREIIGSVYMDYIMSDYSDFIFGLTYRHKDAVIPFVGWHINGFTLGLSY